MTRKFTLPRCTVISLLVSSLPSGNRHADFCIVTSTRASIRKFYLVHRINDEFMIIVIILPDPRIGGSCTAVNYPEEIAVDATAVVQVFALRIDPSKIAYRESVAIRLLMRFASLVS